MWVPRKVATLGRMTATERRMAAEAVVLLAIARLAVITLPFRIIAAWLSRQTATGEADTVLLTDIRRAVTSAARNVPWNAVCLPQAMAAKAMLTRRNCSATFHVGAGFDATGKLIGHAWLTAGDTIVVGAAGIDDVRPLARLG